MKSNGANQKIESILFFRGGSLAPTLSRAGLFSIAIAATMHLSACGKMSAGITNLLNSEKQESLSGTVKPMAAANSAATAGPNPKITYASSCSNAQAVLIELDNQGKRKLPPKVTTSVSTDGKFEFTRLSESGVDVSSFNTLAQYIIEIQGCAESYARIVTGLNSQNVDHGSTVLSWLSETTQSTTLRNAASAKIESLMAAVSSASTFDEAYFELQNNASARTIFSEAFGSAPAVLLDAAPRIVDASVPTSANELTSVSFSSTIKHWSPSYPLLAIWKVDGSIISSSSSGLWIPSANSQGAHTVELTVGRNNGSGTIDTTKPFDTKVFALTVNNNIAPQVPPVSLTTAASTNSPSIGLLLDTGALVGGIPANCASFSALAMTESDDSAPITTPPGSSDFNIHCTDPVTQALTFTLTTGEGPKTLRLWARDSSGAISATSRLIQVAYSTSGPSLTIASPSAGSAQRSSVSISGTCTTDAGSVTATGDIASAASAACVAGSYSVAVTLASGDGPKNISISQTDPFGNTSVTSRSFILDTIPPVLAIDSPANGDYVNASNAAAFTVTGTCSDSVSVSFTATVGSSQKNETTNCTSGAFAKAIDLNSLPDGSLSLEIESTDAAGNSATPSTVTLTKDTIAPTATLSDTPPPLSRSTSLAVAVGGIGATHYQYKIGSAASTICSASGGYSNDVLLGSIIGNDISGQSDGALRLCVVAKDAADNLQAYISATSYTWTKDTTVVPLSGLTVSPVSPARIDQPTLTGSTEPSAIVELYTGLACSGPVLASDTAHASTGGFSLTPGSSIGSDGTYGFYFKATDLAGNTLCSSSPLTYTLDTTAPSLTLSLPGDLTETQGSLLFAGTCESGLPVDFSGSGYSSGGPTSCTAGAFSTTISLSAGEGPKSVTVSQTDGAGNISSITRSLVRDNTPPAITQTGSASPILSNGNSVTFSGACESGLPISIVLNGVVESSTTCTGAGTWTYEVATQTTDASRSYIFEQVDTAGNSGEVTAVWTRDTTAPALTFASSGIQNSHTKTNTNTFSGSCETGRTITITGGVDSGTASCTASSWTYTTAAQTSDAVRSYTFSQTDAAGNATTITGTWTRDTIAPAFTWNLPAAGVETTSGLTITGSCEIGTPVKFSGAGILSDFTAACSSGTFSQAIFFSASDGAKTITVGQTDLAGNTTAETRSFVRDSVAPTITQTTVASPTSNHLNTITFGGTCEAGLSISVKLNGAAESSTTCGSGTWTYSVATQTSDATRTYSFEQTDAAGNTGAVNAQWVRDTVAPALSFSSASSQFTASNQVTFSGSCENGLTISISGGIDTGTAPCTSGGWTYVSSAQSTDGTRSYTFTQTDLAGNSTSIVGTWTRDTAGPQLVVSGSNMTQNRLDSATFTGTCSTGLTISVSGAASTSLGCLSGTWTYSPTATGDARRTYTLSQTDALNRTTSVTLEWTRDTTGPVLASGQTLINGGLTTLSSAYGTLSFAATDTLSKVADFCIKVDSSTAPTSDDTCWIPLTASPPNVTPASSVSVTNFPFLISFDPGSHSVYVWARDDLQNISTLTSSGAGTAGQDTATVTYSPAAPPSVDNVIATRTDLPNNPPSLGEMTVAAGETVIVKWKATSASGFGSNPIRISFSTDNSNWTQLTGSATNGANGSCTPDHVSTAIDNGNTGCYAFTSPTGAAFQVRVTATDSNGLSTFKSSTLLNTNGIKIIAGATETGLGASAKSAMLLNRLIDWTDLNLVDTGNFVIHPNGTVYFNDRNRGILQIQPSDGILQQFIRWTGVASGDGGAATAATLNKPYKITLDAQNRLLIWDFDRIRRVDLVTGTITTIIGGGTDTSDTVTNPLNLRIDPSHGISNMWNDAERNYRVGDTPFFALPNGDIYFQSDRWNWEYTGNRFRVYRPGDVNKIQTIQPNGIGHSLGAMDISNCSLYNFAVAYDPATSALQSAVARIYNANSRANCNPNGTAPMHAFVFLNPAGFASRSSIATNHPPPRGSIDTWPEHFVTGRDGKLYSFSRSRGAISRFNPATSTWTVIAGGIGNGTCADGTAVNSCRMEPIDVFITPESKIFFMDRGRLRTITSDGKVTTIYGQSFGAGDGGHPMQARFGKPSQISVANDGSTLVYDMIEMKLREINSSRTMISHVAGAGHWAFPQASNALTEGTHWDCGKPGTVYDPATKDIYYRSSTAGGARLIRLNRSTGNWESVAGGGATLYYAPAANGLDGTNVFLGSPGGWSCSLQVLGSANGKILMHSMASWYDTGSLTTYSNPYVLSFDTATGTMNQIAGLTGNNLEGYGGPSGDLGARYCPNGTDLANCQVPFTVFDVTRGAAFDTVGNRWLLQASGAPGTIRSADLNTGKMQTLVALPREAQGGFAYRRAGGQQHIYYCYAHRLYKYVVETATETVIALPSGMQCGSVGDGDWATQNIGYNSGSDAVTFVFNLNGLYGIAELTNP